jgi:serine/threonine protein kinase
MTAINKIGKYTVLDELGTGGFGTVYLVEHNNNRYALKQLSKGVMAPEISERFIRESLRIEELRQKHQMDYLVKIFDVLFAQNAFVMEFIPESSLDYFSRQRDERFLLSLVRAVYQLHRYGVAHRDIKPANLRARNAQPVLIDFGIASWWDSKSNIIPTGTKYYSPPEMVSVFSEFKKLTAARNANKELIEIIPDNPRGRIKYIKKIHDVYSLGITIGELLNGTLPFNQHTYSQYLQNGYDKGFQEWLKKLPARFGEFVERATRFSPVQRLKPDELMKYLDVQWETDILDIKELLPEEESDYFQENYYKCLTCARETLPPANFCPYCGKEVQTVMLHIEPEQVLQAKSLPPAVKVLGNSGFGTWNTRHAGETWDSVNIGDPGNIGKAGNGRLSLVIDLEGEDFDLVIGRTASGAQMVFPDDNWMSGYHGRLIKEKEKIYYIDGCEGRLPTNPGLINNIPVGKARIELLSGIFLLLGSTIFKIKKYFGKI